MPRWLGALMLMVVGVVGLYQGIANPCVTLRGSKRPLTKWQGRIFYGILAAVSIGGGILVFFGPF